MVFFTQIEALYTIAITSGRIKEGGKMGWTDAGLAEKLNLSFRDKQQKKRARIKIIDQLKALQNIEYKTEKGKLYLSLLTFTAYEGKDIKKYSSETGVKAVYLIKLEIKTHDNRIGCTTKIDLKPHIRLQDPLSKITCADTQNAIGLAAKTISFLLPTYPKKIIEDAEIYKLPGWKQKERRNKYLKILQDAFPNLIITIQYHPDIHQKKHILFYITRQKIKQETYDGSSIEQ